MILPDSQVRQPSCSVQTPARRLNYARPLQTQQNAKTIDFPGKTQPETEHNKHYRTLLVGLERVRFPVGIATIAAAGLIAAIIIAQRTATACVSVTSYLGCVLREMKPGLMGSAEPIPRKAILEDEAPRSTPLG